MNTVPQFRHDCFHCTFLGNVLAGGRAVDLYFCKQGGCLPTVIARYSDTASDYVSGLSFGHPETGSYAELISARAIAVKKGILKE